MIRFKQPRAQSQKLPQNLWIGFFSNRLIKKVERTRSNDGLPATLHILVLLDRSHVEESTISCPEIHSVAILFKL